MATGLTPGDTCFDENEAIDIYEYDVAQLKQMAMSGEIIDGKTICAILLVAEKLGI